MAFTVGKLAEIAGINLETIRYYERIGLLPEPMRNDSGYRVYDKESLYLLRFILNAKKVGFSLKEIKELLSIQVIPDKKCIDVKERAVQKLREIEKKIMELKKIRLALIRLTKLCDGNATIDKCKIIQILGDNEEER